MRVQNTKKLVKDAAALDDTVTAMNLLSGSKVLTMELQGVLEGRPVSVRLTLNNDENLTKELQRLMEQRFNWIERTLLASLNEKEPWNH